MKKLTPSEYTRPLVLLFESNSNIDDAAPMKRYMRNQFDFLGIKSKRRRELFREFVAGSGLPDARSIGKEVRALWRLPYREYQYAGTDLLYRARRTLQPSALSLCSTLITSRSWWDTVDSLAARIVGHLLRTYPDERGRWIDQWRSSDNIWLRRTTLIFQLKYGNDTDWNLLAELALQNADSSEFFIQKAIGWALRQYSKYQPETVAHFVEAGGLPALSKREALKWIASRRKHM